MWILPLVGYLGSVVGFCFMTLAIGAFPALGPSGNKRSPRGACGTSTRCDYDADLCVRHDSLWSLLPLRNRRRTYRDCEAPPYETDLLHHGPAADSLRRRPVPLAPDGSGHLLPLH